jgi:DNA ligase (NAD+)
MYSTEQQQQLYTLTKELLAGKNLAPPDEMNLLAEVIRYHEWRYYVLDNPVLSDFEYDQLFLRLKTLEDFYPHWKRADSPTQRVSDDLTNTFDTAQHLTPMLSLENSYNLDDLEDFDRRLKDTADLPPDLPIQYVVEPKFDGGTIALVYENDQLVRAATRGNGVAGEDITSNARTFRSVPLQAAFSALGIAKVELRGEALTSIANFKKMNAQRQAAGLTLFANARNAATGALRMKDPREAAARHIEVFVYQLGYATDKDGNNCLHLFDTHYKAIQMLQSMGFKVPQKELKLCDNIAEVHAFCDHWQQQRDQYAYEIDGMVVKANSRDLQEKVGYTSHHPRWAIAFKFKARQATSKLLDVEFQVGKTGAVTPVAKIEPVQLAGVTVQSISLHNEEFIRSKDLRINDQVLVERAGDVIPYIVKSFDDLRNGSEQLIQFPTHCPSCATPLVRQVGEAAWKCDNTAACSAQLVQRLIHHVSKDAMDIEGMGEKQIEKFYELGWLKNIADLYRLDYQKIALLDGFGQKSADNLQKSIEKAKKQPLGRLIHSFSIPLVGKTVSKTFAAAFTDIRLIGNATVEQLMTLKDIGPKVADNVKTFFTNPQNIALLNELDQLGVNLLQLDDDLKPASAETGPLAGKTILFTGSFATLNRDEAEATAAAAGAKIASGVTSKLNILVVGEKAGSKLAKAQALGTVQILDEQGFYELLNPPPITPSDDEVL